MVIKWYQNGTCIAMNMWVDSHHAAGERLQYISQAFAEACVEVARENPGWQNKNTSGRGNR